MIRQNIILFVFVTLTIYLKGQQNKYVEEIALHHLGKIKNNKILQNFKYYTNGKIANDTNYISVIKEIVGASKK